jgi:hypothetical protein
MNMNTLLESLYQKDTAASSLEKTAEQAMLEGLRESNQVEENPFMDMSMDELVKLAGELGVEVSTETDTDTEIDQEEHTKEASEEDPEELEKIAFDMLGGQLMAHSMVHEFGLMKEAMVNGYCRVCKENQMDVDGATVCSECISEE